MEFILTVSDEELKVEVKCESVEELKKGVKDLKASGLVDWPWPDKTLPKK